jgi:hypothetical protein
VRSAALEAHEVRVRKLATGIRDDESIEAEAGRIMRAETDHNIHILASMVHRFMTSRG